MKTRRLFIPFILVPLVTIACRLAELGQPNNATPAAPVEDIFQSQVSTLTHPDSTAAQELCLIGDWEISGLSDYILALIPPEMAEQYKLKYQGTNGRAYFSLLPDGSLILQADQLELLFEAQASIFKVPVTASVDGQVSGKYTVEGDTLTTSDMDTSGLSASAKAMGNDLMDPAQIINALPLMSPPYNTAQYSCSGDKLQRPPVRLPRQPTSARIHAVN